MLLFEQPGTRPTTQLNLSLPTRDARRGQDRGQARQSLFLKEIQCRIYLTLQEPLCVTLPHPSSHSWRFSTSQGTRVTCDTKPEPSQGDSSSPVPQAQQRNPQLGLLHPSPFRAARGKCWDLCLQYVTQLRRRGGARLSKQKRISLIFNPKR